MCFASRDVTTLRRGHRVVDSETLSMFVRLLFGKKRTIGAPSEERLALIVDA